MAKSAHLWLGKWRVIFPETNGKKSLTLVEKTVWQIAENQNIPYLGQLL
jgi:hypothetical protein